MTDTKKTAATEVQDEALEDVQGGYQYQLKNIMVTSYQTGGTGAVSAAEEELMVLRKRPTRIEGEDIMGDVEKVGVLRKRPTR